MTHTPPKSVEKLYNWIIEVGAEVNTYQDGDAYGFKTFTFNEAQLTALVSSALADRERELTEAVHKMDYAGALDSNEKRREYDVGRPEFLALITTPND